MEASAKERLHFGKMGYGCKHYRRRCRIRAPCCNEVFSCRHCHNEAASMLRNISDRHEIVRQDVSQVICSVCDTEQPVAQVCTNCGVSMGEYFCEICRFYDDDTEKGQFHCDDCGICRIGGRENFFHCKKCGSCYSIALRNNHLCVENSMHHHCPICFEYLFDSLKDTAVMKCGHTMHSECYHEMIKRDKYCCPICSKSVIDMSKTWQRIDEEGDYLIMPTVDKTAYEWGIIIDDEGLQQVYMHKQRHGVVGFKGIYNCGATPTFCCSCEYNCVCHMSSLLSWRRDCLLREDKCTPWKLVRTIFSSLVMEWTWELSASGSHSKGILMELHHREQHLRFLLLIHSLWPPCTYSLSVSGHHKSCILHFLHHQFCIILKDSSFLYIFLAAEKLHLYLHDSLQSSQGKLPL